jgi:predicted GNAT family N-acyltransferase
MSTFIVKKMSSISSKKELVSEGLLSNPVLQNYHDLMMLESDQEWMNYRFFSFRDSRDKLIALGGLNALNALNLYGIIPGHYIDFVDAIKDQEGIESLTALRGNIAFQKAIYDCSRLSKQLKSKTVFNCFINDELKNNYISNKYEVRLGTLDDKEFIEKWIKLYNQEMSTNYSKISNSKIEQGKIFLMIDSATKTIVGALINSILKNKNFWIGRLFIFPKFRGSALGKEFLSLLDSYLVKENYVIHAHTVTTNNKAKKLFEECGYKYLGDGFNASFNTASNH